MLAILPKGHALLKHTSLLPEHFEGENFVSLGANYPSRKLIDAVFLASNVKRKLQVETQLSLAVGNLVASGAGVSIIDSVNACNLRDLGLIETRPFVPDIIKNYYVLLPSHKPLSRLGETFLEITQQHLASADNN